MISFEKLEHPKYKYHLTDDLVLPLSPEWADQFVMLGDWVVLRWATLFLKKGYAWDGASGAIDTMNFARGSVGHDSLYQLIAEGLLPYKPFKKMADAELKRIILEDGMGPVRATWVHAAVRLFGRAKDKYKHPE